MNFTTLSPTLQELLLYSFETKVKITLFVGFLLISFAYVFYFSKQHKQTNSLLLALFRVTSYYITYSYLWIFWILFVFIINPKVNIENILIGLISIYSILLIVFFVLYLSGSLKQLQAILIKVGLLKEPDSNEDSIRARIFNNK